MTTNEEHKLTGYPSIDKPWLKYYSKQDIEAQLPQGNMYDYLVERNKNRMSDVAFAYMGKNVSFDEFFTNIEMTAKAFCRAGVRKGSVVSICVLTMPEFLYSLYALNRIGAICNFIAVNATQEIMERQIVSSGSEVLVAIDFVLPKVKELIEKGKIKKIIVSSLRDSMPPFLSLVTAFKFHSNYKDNAQVTKWKDFVRDGRKEIPKYADSDETLPAIIEYTSGTTGEPKGAVLANKAANAIAFNYAHMNDMLVFNKGEIYMDILPPFYSYGVFFGAHMPLCLGLRVVLIPNPAPEAFPAYFRKYKPNHFGGGPLHIENLIKDSKVQKMDLSFLKTAAFGGDGVDREWEKTVSTFLSDHGAKNGVNQGYGMTEMAGPFCACAHKYDFMLPFVKNNIKIIDTDTKQELGYDQDGEICVSGPSMMECYYNQPNKMDEITWVEDGVRWLRTGDLGRITKEGHFVVSGRLKRIYWTVGREGIFRVYPMKIEDVILSSGLVEQCAVIGRKDKEKGYISIAYIVPKNKNDSQETIKKLTQLCEEKLEETSRPVEYHTIDTLPTTQAGKVDYKRMEEEKL